MQDFMRVPLPKRDELWPLLAEEEERAAKEQQRVAKQDSRRTKKTPVPPRRQRLRGDPPPNNDRSPSPELDKPPTAVKNKTKTKSRSRAATTVYKDDVPPPEESADSEADDDFAETRRKKDRDFERRRKNHPSLTRTESDDEQETQDFEREVGADGEDDAANRPRPRTRGRSKGKGKAKQSTPPADDEDNDDPDDDAGADTHRAGPLSNEAKEQAQKLLTDYNDALAALARAHGKDVNVLQRYLGMSSKQLRKKVPWNGFQGFLTAPDGRDMHKPEEMDPSAWTTYTADLWKKELRSVGLDPAAKPDAATIFAAMPWLKTWMDKNRAEVVDFRVEVGAFPADVNKFATSLSKLCAQGYEQLGGHAFGQIIDTGNGNNAFFGGSEAVSRLRQQDATYSKKVLKEYEHKLGLIASRIQREAAGDDVVDDDTPLTRWVSDKERWDRDHGRGFVKDRLIAGQVAIEQARGTYNPDDDYPMHWSWADHAFERHMAIVNWPDSMARRFPGNGFTQTSLSNSDLQLIVPGLERAMGNVKWANKAVAAPSKTVSVVEWSQDDKDRDVADQGEVPLVTTVTGIVLLKVSDSKKFIKQTGGKVTKKRRERARSPSNDGDDDTAVPPPKPKKSVKSKSSHSRPPPPSPPPSPSPPPPPPPARHPRAPSRVAPEAGPSSLPPHQGQYYPPPGAPPPQSMPHQPYPYYPGPQQPYIDPRYSWAGPPSFPPYQTYPQQFHPGPPAPQFPPPQFPPVTHQQQFPPAAPHQQYPQRQFPPSDYRSRDEPVAGPSGQKRKFKQEEKLDEEEEAQLETQPVVKKPRTKTDPDRRRNGDFTSAEKERLRAVATQALSAVQVRVRFDKDIYSSEMEGKLVKCTPEELTAVDTRIELWDPAELTWKQQGLPPDHHFVADESFVDVFTRECRHLQ
ncbi:hypothetical protein C8R46DRAFT_1052148 [Mycena filopes]|nr:hypothetical protein C8R46DRAFT_1052148 [Mycena filopes]